MNLKVVVEIDDVVDAEKAAEVEIKRRRKALGLLRIVADRGLQVICYSYFSTPSRIVADRGLQVICYSYFSTPSGVTEKKSFWTRSQSKFLK
jgi:hypothetical protein